MFRVVTLTVLRTPESYYNMIFILHDNFMTIRNSVLYDDETVESADTGILL